MLNISPLVKRRDWACATPTIEIVATFSRIRFFMLLFWLMVETESLLQDYLHSVDTTTQLIHSLIMGYFIAIVLPVHPLPSE